MSETKIDSFILRFVHDMPSDADQASINWHGLIRHVQSKESTRFSNFEDAFEFINNYVRLSKQIPRGSISSEDISKSD